MIGCGLPLLKLMSSSGSTGHSRDQLVRYALSLIREQCPSQIELPGKGERYDVAKLSKAQIRRQTARECNSELLTKTIFIFY